MSRPFIEQNVRELLQDMTRDWDMDFNGALGPQTGLVADLAFESIDIVELVVAIEERFRQRGLPFEKLLMKDGRYVDEIRIGNLVDFLATHLKG